MTVEKMLNILEQNSKPSVGITLDENAVGRSYFGGIPELPTGVEYPKFECSTFEDDEIKLRPLHFLAQIDCAELAEFDKSGLMPKKGRLLFFYRCDSNVWGFDPADKGVARVIYCEENGTKPEISEEITVFPKIPIKFSKNVSYPDIENLERLIGEKVDCEIYQAALSRLDDGYGRDRHKMTGFADVMQNTMELECELVSRGFYLGNGYPKLDDFAKIARDSLDDWVLLFQLSTVEKDEFELMFGDCGRIYFYIRKSDLAECRFDRVWMILQC